MEPEEEAAMESDDVMDDGMEPDIDMSAGSTWMLFASISMSAWTRCAVASSATPLIVTSWSPMAMT